MSDHNDNDNFNDEFMDTEDESSTTESSSGDDEDENEGGDNDDESSSVVEEIIMEGDEDDDDDDVSFSSSLFSSSSIEEDVSGDGTAAATTVIHYGISCDECGVCPLRGIRYHSRRIIDYDICEDCYQGNHKHWTIENAFLALNVNANVDETTIFKNEDTSILRMDVYGWIDLIECLETNHTKLQSLDLNLDAYEDSISLRPNLTEEYYEKVSSWIGQSQVLKCLYVEFPRGVEEEYHSHMLHSILNGVNENQSIITLSLTFDFAEYPESLNQTCDLIRTHKRIRHLFLRHKKKRLDAIEQGHNNVQYLTNLVVQAIVQQDPIAQAEVQAHIQPNDNLIHRRQNVIRSSIQSLFQALSEDSSLHSFACRGTDLTVGNECRIAAVQALTNCPYLKTIKADFVDSSDNDVENTTTVESIESSSNGGGNDGCDDDLDRLMKEKQNWWVRDWNDLDVTNHKLLHILDDIRIRVDEQDQVAALFHLIRNNPGSLPKNELEA